MKNIDFEELGEAIILVTIGLTVLIIAILALFEAAMTCPMTLFFLVPMLVGTTCILIGRWKS